MSKKEDSAKSGEHRSGENLPDAELEVMACLWNQDTATARELREEMAAQRPMAHGSMLTLLKRLEAKGFVSKKKGSAGKAFVYTPTRGPKQTYRRIMKNLHERVFGGSGVTMMTSLFESRPPSQSELDDLQKLLDKLRSEGSERGKCNE